MIQPPVLVLAPNSWTGPWMNRQQLFSRIGKLRKVLYSTGAWSTRDIGTQSWRASPFRGAWLKTDNVMVDVPPKLWLAQERIPALKERVLNATADRWSQIADDEHLILYVFHPSFLPYVGRIRHEFLVYHAYDLYERQRGWTNDLAKAQTSLIRRADLVLASSDVIAQALSDQAGRPVHTLPNGADVEAFRGAAANGNEPSLLAAIPRPRIGYTGHLNRKVDFRLIEILARRHPDWHFVLIGLLKEDTNVGGLRGFPNVHWLGEQHREEVPSLVAAMDVNIICNDLSDHLWVRGCYPLKLHEYLAAGRPVVSADIPAVRQFSDVVAIAHSAEQWVGAIEAAIGGDGVGTVVERQNEAARNSWEARVVELMGLLDEMVSARALNRAAPRGTTDGSRFAGAAGRP